jgi:16S rRNA (cytidine1402-2'-O)-methyltransferase
MSPAGQGELVLVATPIGNLGDLSPRAQEVLAAADLICCEDTRRTRALLSACGIRAGDRLLSLHGHNERERLARVAAVVAAGGLVAVVSDAGTPGISDPGAWLAAQVAAAGEKVTTVPGPSSVIAALVVSGLPTDRFGVEGFLPRKGAERRRRLAALMADERTAVVLGARSGAAGGRRP